MLDRKRTGHLSEEILLAYGDNRLSGDQQDLVDRYLNEHPEELEALAAYRRQDEVLHRCYDRYLDEPLSQPAQALVRRIEEMTQEAAQKRHRWRRGRRSNGVRRHRAVLASAASALIAVIGWNAYERLSGSSNVDLFAMFSSSAPVVAATENREPAQGNGVQTAKLVTEESTAQRPQGEAAAGAPDFSSFGYQLTATRILDPDRTNSTQLIYESAERKRILLYFWKTADSNVRQLSLTQEGPVSMLFWVAAGRSYGMIGEVDRDTLLAMGKVVSGDLAAQAGDAAPQEKKEAPAAAAPAEPPAAGPASPAKQVEPPKSEDT